MKKIRRVTRVRHVTDYRLEVSFSDGVTAEVDLRDRIVGRGGMSAPLENVKFFRRVQVDPETGTLVWPNDYDICPVLLYALATKKSLPARSHS